MKQKLNNRKKEAIKANKHLDKDTKRVNNVPEQSANVSKDLSVTAVSTIICVLVAIALYYILG